jgi:hypothetical protein
MLFILLTKIFGIEQLQWPLNHTSETAVCIPLLLRQPPFTGKQPKLKIRTKKIKYTKHKPYIFANMLYHKKHYTRLSKSLCAPDDYCTKKNTQKYFKQFQSLTMIM